MYKKEIRPGVIQVNLDEERWYYLKEKPFPSVTWILNSFPKGIGFDIYLAEKVHSWEQAKQVLREAGEQGSRVHWGLEQFLLGKPLRFTDCPNGSPYPFSIAEWRMIEDGIRWFDKYKPTVLSVEETVFGSDYAGTVDLMYQLNDKIYIEDWKTSQYIYPSHHAQQAAYVKALRNNDVNVEGYCIVQLGTKSKIRYKEIYSTEESIKYYYHLFRCAMRFWKHENPNPAPRYVEIQESFNTGEKDESQLEI